MAVSRAEEPGVRVILGKNQLDYWILENPTNSKLEKWGCIPWMFYLLEKCFVDRFNLFKHAGICIIFIMFSTSESIIFQNIQKNANITAKSFSSFFFFFFFFFFFLKLISQ